ncbi:MAG: FAD-binding oxidoreductase [Rhizobiaceae bacterium]
MSNAPSWGRLIQRNRSIHPFDARHSKAKSQSILPYGNGRSYGDSCHNDAGSLVHLAHQKSVLAFDRETGTMTAEAGILLRDILQQIQGTGWFLPVVPGTKFVTLGGAIANDIHGKNHEKRGTFGRHVESLTLWRSTGELLTCSATQNTELFEATISGMGLTGVIVSAQFKLMNVPSHFVEETNTPFANLDAYFDSEEDWADEHEYSVAWVDSLSHGKALGRGISITGKHIEDKAEANYGDPRWTVPLTPPVPLVSGLPLKLFNAAYFHGKKRKPEPHISTPDSFFFPLDAVAGWNRLYGPRGLFQHQCVIPLAAARQVVPAMLRTSHEFGQGSFLTVLKRFGAHCSPGHMSFPQPGYTLTLDFANRGAATRELLNRLDAITLDVGGRTNPYKDGRMSAETFQRGYADWQKLEELRDPAIQSDFWRRVTQPLRQRRITPAPSIAAPSIAALPGSAKKPVNQAAQPGVQKTQLHLPRETRPARAASMGIK